MIIVLALIFSVISIRNEARSAARSDGQHANIGKIMWKALPKFILAFVAMIAVNTILRGNIADTYFYQSLFKPLFGSFITTPAKRSITIYTRCSTRKESP